MSADEKVTPELLAALSAHASAAMQGKWRACEGSARRRGHRKPLALGDAFPPPEGGESCICRQVWDQTADVPVAYALEMADESFTCGDGPTSVQARANARHIAAASPAVVLALVARIRELEDAWEEAVQAGYDRDLVT